MVKMPVWWFKPSEMRPKDGKTIAIYHAEYSDDGDIVMGYYKENTFFTSNRFPLNPDKVLGWAYLAKPNMDHTQISKEREL